MEPLIRAVLSNLLGDDANDIEIISNSVDVHEDGSWNIKFRHPARYAPTVAPIGSSVPNTLSPQWIWARQIAGNPPIQETRKPPIAFFLWRWCLGCVFLFFFKYFLAYQRRSIKRPRLSSYVILRLICGLSRPFCRQTCRCPIREREIRRRE